MLGWTRLLFLAIVTGLSAVLLAQEKTFLGTKPDPIGGVPSSTSPTLMPALQVVIVAVILVVAMKTVAPKLMAKLNRRMVTQPGGGIHVDESASFAGGTLYVVRARDKVLLLSVGANGVQCLSDLTPINPEPKLPVFMDMVDQSLDERGDSAELPREYLEVEVPSAATATTEPQDPTSAALDRLQRFIS